MPRTWRTVVSHFCFALFLFLSTTNIDMNMMADAFGQPSPPTPADSNPTPSDPQAPGVTAPTHLTVLVHGFVGQPGDLNYLQSSITKFGKGKVLAHTAKCNLGRTHDGVAAGGERLAEEVRQLVAANPSLQGISFVGNSLGGLYSRYALSLLWAPEKKTIALLRPVTFMTVATPHLGVRRFTMVPLPDKLHFTAPLFLGQTGNDLFLRRSKKEGSDGSAAAEAAGSDAAAAATTSTSTSEEQSQTTTPLLLRMAQEPRFLDPLAAFEHRRAYGNVREDMLVPMGTSLFHPVGPLAPKHTLRETLVLPDPITSHATLEIYHLASEGRSGVAAGVSSLTNALSSSSSGGGPVGGLMASDEPGQDWMEPFMAQRLNALGWEKVAVDFKFAFLNAHNMICSLSRDRVTSFLFKKGRSVMDHAAQNIVSNAERAEKASL